MITPQELSGFIYHGKENLRPDTRIRNNPQYLKALQEYIFIDHSEQVKSCDAGIILGRHVLEELLLIIEQARTKLQEIKFQNIIASGGAQRGGFPEAHIISEALQDVYPSMILEPTAVHTGQNIEFSKQIIGQENIPSQSIGALGELFHARRVLMTLQKYFPDKIVGNNILFYALETPRYLNHDNFFMCGEGTRTVYGEIDRILQYSEEGEISALKTV